MDDRRILHTFLKDYLKDQIRGQVRSLGEYQLLYPGHEELIARQWAMYTEGVGLGADAMAAQGMSVWLKEGESLGSYRILRELGRGGQGVVYLAEETSLQRHVALKVLTGMGPGAEEAVMRFQREAQVASRIEHPGICSIHDAGMEDGIPYIAMRYVKGETLAKKISEARTKAAERATYVSVEMSTSREEIQSGEDPSSSSQSSGMTRVELDQILEFFESTARALHAAHEAGVVHRDIKPGNIMVTPEGKPVILDFGLASDELGNLPSLTATGDIFGTPAYMSPEQIAAKRVNVDRRTDVYSLGVVLFECLTLRRPFEAPTREGLYRAIMTKEPPDPRRINKDISRDLLAVLQAALEKDCDRRYQTAEAFAQDLKAMRDLRPVQVKPIGPVGRLIRWSKRNPALAGSLTAVVLVLIFGLVLTTWQWTRAEANLARYDQMSDAALLQDLVNRADGLWPRRPHLLPAMPQWLDEAQRLYSRLQLHEAALQELRNRAAHSDTEHRLVDANRDRDVRAKILDSIPEREERVSDAQKMCTELNRQLVEIDSLIEEEGNEDLIARYQMRRSDLEARCEELREAIAESQDELTTLRLSATQDTRHAWQLSDPADHWRHAVLSQLVRELRGFRSLIEDVEKRRSVATTIVKRSIDDHQAAWDRCLGDLDTNPQYASSGNLRGVEAQIGLVPLGIDRDSGFWEFAHVESGKVPNWDGPNWADDDSADLEGKVQITASSSIVLVLLPAGTFWMGATRDASARNYDAEADSDESPVVQVTLDAFFMSKYELTQAQWWRLTREKPSTPRVGSSNQQGGLVSGRHPVTNVDWNQTREVMRRWNLELPTEARWEYACRARTPTPYWTGETVASIQGQRAGNIADKAASRHKRWKCTAEVDDGYVIHAPVGSFEANGFGLHDVLGNVWEWCQDSYISYEHPTRPGDGLRLGPGQHDPVRRGGSFYFPAFYSRSTYRNHPRATFQRYDLGVRPAASISDTPLESRD